LCALTGWKHPLVEIRRALCYVNGRTWEVKQRVRKLSKVAAKHPRNTACSTCCNTWTNWNNQRPAYRCTDICKRDKKRAQRHLSITVELLLVVWIIQR